MNLHRHTDTTPYHVVHDTAYLYGATVNTSQQLLHMRPRDFEYQYCSTHALNVNPQPDEWIERQDFFGNWQSYFSIWSPHQTLNVHSEFQAHVSCRPTLDTLLAQAQPWLQERSLLQQQSAQHASAYMYLFPSPAVKPDAAVAEYAAHSFSGARPLLEAVMDLTTRIHRDFIFDPTATTTATPVEEIFANRRGVCQDFAHLMIACLRSQGLPCRYVSGYIVTNPPPGMPRLVGADASHAWVSVYSPAAGWVDFDPTNNCLVNNQHITVGWGRDFTDVSLMNGVVLGGGRQSIRLAVTVTPL